MKKVVMIFLAVSFCFILMGYAIDWKSYLNGFTHVPNMLDLVEEIKNIIEDIRHTWDGSLYSSWNGSWWMILEYIWNTICGIANTLKCVGELLFVVPVKALWYLLQIIWAFIPHRLVTL